MLPLEIAPEFSAASFGAALRAAVRASPHYISVSAVGQSLVFLGDFFEVHASAVAPRLASGMTVVSDRGYVTKYAYQEVVLSDIVGVLAARRLLDQIFRHLPPPALTIYLTAPEDCVRDRLVARDGSCDQTRVEFMARAAVAATGYLRRHPGLKSVTVDTNRPLGAVMHDVRLAVRSVVPYSS
jgi:thymidylate kinase